MQLLVNGYWCEMCVCEFVCVCGECVCESFVLCSWWLVMCGGVCADVMRAILCFAVVGQWLLV